MNHSSMYLAIMTLTASLLQVLDRIEVIRFIDPCAERAHAREPRVLRYLYLDLFKV